MFLRIILCLVLLLPNLVYAEDVKPDSSTISKTSILEALEASPTNLSNSLDTKPAFQYWNDIGVERQTKKEPSSFNKAISEIKNNPSLQKDPEIQERLVQLYKQHPFTYIKTIALSALPLDHPEHAAFNKEDYYYSNKAKINYGSIREEINESIGYCSYGKPLKSCSTCSTDEETEALTPIQNGKKMKNIRISTRDVGDGKLVGYSYFSLKHGFGYYSNFGKHNDLGLHYIPEDDNLATSLIYPNNIRYISHKKADGSFWGITSWPAKCGQSSILKITELGIGSFNVEPYIQLPGPVEGIGEGENGDIYIYFGNEESFDSQCRPTRMPIGRSSYYNNPPLILTSAGDVKSACEKNAEKF